MSKTASLHDSVAHNGIWSRLLGSRGPETLRIPQRVLLIIILLCGCIILSVPALINGYPLVDSDSGSKPLYRELLWIILVAIVSNAALTACCRVRMSDMGVASSGFYHYLSSSISAVNDASAFRIVT